MVTRILSAKLINETSVGTSLTAPLACLEAAGYDSSLTSVEDSIIREKQFGAARWIGEYYGITVQVFEAMSSSEGEEMRHGPQCIHPS